MNSIRQNVAKTSPVSQEKRDFILKTIKLNVPAEFSARYIDTVLRHHDCVSQNRFDLAA